MPKTNGKRLHLDAEPEVLDKMELLILEVEKNPILWDKSRADFKRTDMKDDVWGDIAKNVGTTECLHSLHVYTTLF